MADGNHTLAGAGVPHEAEQPAPPPHGRLEQRVPSGDAQPFGTFAAGVPAEAGNGATQPAPDVPTDAQLGEEPSEPVSTNPTTAGGTAAEATTANTARDETPATDATTAEGTASHDIDIPEPLRSFMASGWAPVDGVNADRDLVAGFGEARRKALGALFPGDTLVVPSGSLKVRANDTDYPFRPDSDFVWLTGCTEPDAVLLLSPDGGATLFIADRSDRSSTAFYTDRRYGELWVGPRRGVRETAAALGIACRPLTELEAALDRLAPGSTRVFRGADARVDALVRPLDPEREALTRAVAGELRLIKDDYEIGQLVAATDATARGFADCVAQLPVACQMDRGERWLEGTFWRRARLEGNDVGYGSIVATGPHATTLHWVRNDGRVRAGELALLDMGVEMDSLYTADVTRTLPIGGKFSEVQRMVYDAVLAAQQAGIEAVRPGNDFLAPHRAAMAVLAQALEDWGILPCSAEESLRPEVGLHRRYTLHATSHMLGLDVHDCSQARKEHYRDATLAPGMVLTVEPGLYFQLDDLTVPPAFRGIGVRIEDDVLVTADGCRVLSDQLPRQPDRLEQWVQETA